MSGGVRRSNIKNKGDSQVARCLVFGYLVVTTKAQSSLGSLKWIEMVSSVSVSTSAS